MSEKEGSCDRDVAMDLDDVDEATSGPSRKRQCNGQSCVRNGNITEAEVEESKNDIGRSGFSAASEAKVGENDAIANRKRMAKKDSGISVSREEAVDERVEQEFGRPGEVTKEILRLKVSTNGDVVDPIDEKNSPDSGHQDDYDDSAGEATANMASSEGTSSTKEGSSRSDHAENGEDVGGPKMSEDESFKSDAADDLSVSSSNDDDDDIPLAVKTRPKHNWFLCTEVMRRQYGISNNVSSDLFRLRAYGSLHMVERLELMYMMKRHDGCVNTLHFNNTGTRLASGSDDLNVVIWDWAIGEPLIVYDSGHRSNVFQAKFMPLGGDSLVVSCARDGQVRLGELSSTGVCKGTRRVAHHKGAAHKLALEPDSPHTFLSCGEDGVVFEIDLRESKAEKLLTCKENDRKVPLYTIFAHPTNSNEFAVGGKDHFVRIYDKRQINQGAGVMKRFCPHHILNSDVRANVTCLVYNHNGSELLASYNDEDIYTFDTSHSDGADFTHRYQGHRNSATVKGVNYFGPNSEFVISGSDCGNIYVWERGTESVVQFMAGDEGGVVNCLEPHPHIPVLATSGLDDSVKIWVPSCENAPKLGTLRSVTRSNRREREEDRRREPETIDGQMLWFLMHHLRRSARRRARQEGEQVEDDSPSDPEETNSDDDEEGDGEGFPQSGVQCTTA